MVAAVGALVLCVDGSWMVRPPQHCPNGHELGANRALVGHQPCSCGGHMSWTCLRCDGAVYAPTLAGGCRALAGPAAVR